MAFSSEIRFKIGGDTSALSKSLVAAQSVAATAGKTLEKKLGLKDAVKGLFQGIGIGSVDAIADAVVRPFELAYERSKNILSLTTRTREIALKEIEANGSNRDTIKARKTEVNDLSREIEIQQKLVEDLNSNPINFVSPRGLALLQEAEAELVNLQVRQAEVMSQINIARRAQTRESAQWARNESLGIDLGEAELRDASDREKLQIRLNSLQREYGVIAREGNLGTEKDRKNVSEQFATERAIAQLAHKKQKELAAAQVSAGAALAGRDPSRIPQPRSRGRSERERLADRGVGLLRQAEEAIRTGQSPDFVARLTSRARADLTTAGGKVEASTARVARADAEAVGSKIVETNKILTEIRQNLTPKPVK